MTESETKAIVTISMLAAFVDGADDRERAAIKRIADDFPGELQLPALYQDVLMKRVSLASVARELQSPEAKQLAYEMAVCVCDADGAQSDQERRFLGEVRAALGLAVGDAGKFSSSAEAMATAPLATGSSASTAEIDRMILNAAMTNGALELLPETLSTMAIIPLQMKLVYAIGKSHGYELDSGHIKDFLATAGVGLASQFLEQAGRKLLGGLLGSIGGGLARGMGNQAVSSGMSFASTYAIGHVAQRYYAGGRKLSAAMLRETYQRVMQEGRALQGEYLPAIRDQARNLDPARVLSLVRGN